ncbi:MULTISPECIES: ABC transporter ATP-binding protein [Photorhabdus]|uniref:Inner membrane abc-transporter n=2 Tax=Photorhabdus asymbiotica TaxID=291112 RepID=B6VKV2_PHOAA|nr:ABC transporter ATP-binding protein [Photorhabdus asymbiotica]RKS57248.1 ATP-binding cassette subfamily B protein [Photorhabdus asymbiotica]CAQ84392.1 putative inner membrane abc-transporter [Photorhabdus asymbiotica]CAR66782.1 putative inner membrane abc-transporter [Photorhabdus asymbiotica subsp. asymbiotica ATCC 43949]
MLSNDSSIQNSPEQRAADAGVIKELWNMMRPYRTLSYVAIALAIVSAGLQILPAAVAGLITQSIYDGQYDTLLNYGVMLLSFTFAAMLTFSGSTFVSHLIAADVQADVRRNISSKLKSVPLGFFTRTDSTEIKKMMLDDVEQLEDGIAHIIPEMSATLFGPLIALSVMLAIDWRLALAAFAPTLGACLLFIYIQIKVQTTTQRFYAAQNRIASTMGEVINAIPVVKTYSGGNVALQRAEGAFTALTRIIDVWVEKVQVKSSRFFVLSSANLLFVLPLAVWLFNRQEISLFEFTFFILAAMAFGNIASSMFAVMTRLQQQEALITRYRWLMNQPELVPCTQSQTPADHSVTLHNVSFSYQDEQDNALNNISFSIPAGNSLALVGASGSGKSTVANLIARLWDPQQGQITVGGVDIRNMDEPTLRNNISFVFQRVFLFNDTIANNIRLARPDASQAEVETAAVAAQAHQFIQQLPQGYNTVLNHGISLSVGEKQRIAVAAAILKNAPILVLDEATAYADPECEKEMQQALNALCRNKTVIVIAHRLPTIRHFDQILVLDKGQIIEQGTHDELVAQQGAYASQWSAWRRENTGTGANYHGAI